MKAKLLFIILLFAFFIESVSAQTDSTILQITYEATFPLPKQADSLAHDVDRLDIGHLGSKFYSLAVSKRVLVDSKTAYYGTPCKYVVYKNLPKKGILEYLHMPFWITVKDTIDNLFSWKLEDEDSVICEYPCKKATTFFRGRKWTVWYSTDLPYNDGPWKFCGLPGLVMAARDESKQFTFTCIGIEKGDLHPIIYPKQAKRYVSPQKAEELSKLEITDPEEYFNLMMAGMMKVVKGSSDPKNKVYTAPGLETFRKKK